MRCDLNGNGITLNGSIEEMNQIQYNKDELEKIVLETAVAVICRITNQPQNLDNGIGRTDNTSHATNPRMTLTVSEAAEELGVAKGMVYRLVKSGDIPCRKIGKRIVIGRAGLEQWLRAN